jgi:hypothetical protein
MDRMWNDPTEHSSVPDFAWACDRYLESSAYSIIVKALSKALKDQKRTEMGWAHGAQSYHSSLPPSLSLSMALQPFGPIDSR